MDAVSVRFHKGLLAKIRVLPTKDMVAALGFVEDFEANPAHPAISLERIDGAPGFWSGRAGRGLRFVLAKEGADWLLLHVDQHDAAYAWATRRKRPRRSTGDEVHLVRVVEREEVNVRQVEIGPPVFDGFDDDYLRLLGVHDDALPHLRALQEGDDLSVLIDWFPESVTQRLFSLAEGVRPAPPRATYDHTWRTVTPTVAEEFRALPPESWVHFLHPDQAGIVEGIFSGPVHVAGAAGTGKTVVAMHRAREVARRRGRVLLTCRSRSLTRVLELGLDSLCLDPAVRARIDVRTLHQVAVGLLGRHVEPQTETELHNRLRDGLGSVEAAEWLGVLHPRGLRTWPEYRDTSRVGRQHGFTVRERHRLWHAVDTALDALAAKGLIGFSRLCREAAATAGEKTTYDSVVVDELQDLHRDELELVAALGSREPGNLMLVGDVGQRLFTRLADLAQAGIEVRSRVFTLKWNYRTTEQIRAFADRLRGHQVPSHSLATGPAPTMHAFTTTADQVTWVVERCREAAGDTHSNIGILSRTRRSLEPFRTALGQAGLRPGDLAAVSGVRLGTLHGAKGHEFGVVIVVDCDESQLPLATALKSRVDPADRAEFDVLERNLLYVALTRARDEAVVCWAGRPSPFLDFIDSALASLAPRRPRASAAVLP